MPALLSPGKQHYATKVNELYATYRPVDFQTGAAEKLVARWADGQEEQKFQNMLKKYSRRQPSPEREPSSAGSMVVQPSVDGTLHLSPSTTPHTAQTPESLVTQTEVDSLTPTQEHYVAKVKEVYAMHKPQRLRNNGAEKQVRSWVLGSEEENFHSLVNKYQHKRVPTMTSTLSQSSELKPSNNVTPVVSEPVAPVERQLYHRDILSEPSQPQQQQNPKHRETNESTHIRLSDTVEAVNADLDATIHIDPPMPPYPPIIIPTSTKSVSPTTVPQQRAVTIVHRAIGVQQPSSSATARQYQSQQSSHHGSLPDHSRKILKFDGGARV